MSEQIVVQTLLQKKLALLQQKNPHYSLRSFARKVGLNPGVLSLIINGKRNVSYKLTERITERLMLDPTERAEVLKHFPKPRISVSTETTEYRKLSAHQFKITAEWEHFAILSLLKCKDFKSENAWIANRLGITEARARDCVTRLLEVGMVELDDNGNLIRTSPKFCTTDDIADTSLKKSHEQTLDLAKESLYKDDVKVRDHTWMTMAIDPKKIDMAKVFIRKFQDEFCELVGAGTRTEVYRLSMHFFPLTKLNDKEEVK